MSLYGLSDVNFPHLGIEIHNLPMGVELFGFRIAFYGAIIALGMLLGYLVAESQAKRFGISVEKVLDFAMIAIVASVIGARVYYVIFHWDIFADNPWSVFNLRTGGLAIYGGVIVAFTSLVIFCKVKKLNLGAFSDVCIPGLVTGQAIGRWGNFFNKEAFGKYTDSLFAMQVEKGAVDYEYRLTEEALKLRFPEQPKAIANILEQVEKAVVIDGTSFIQAHPTFLYESLWNFATLAFMLLYAKKKRFDGEMIMWYMVLYGVGRFWIEGLRTDQLFLWNTGIPVSQLVSVVMILIGGSVIGYNYWKLAKAKKETMTVK